MATKKWVVDPNHSELQFKVRHLMISTVTGNLRNFSASAMTEDEDFQNANIIFEGETASIDTGNKDRDAHLKSGEFFDVEQFPAIQFNSSSFSKRDEDYKLDGALTLKGVTKPVVFDVEYGGIAVDPWGNRKAGFTITGKINRTDFDLSWNATLEAGGVMVSEEVKISGELQFVEEA